MPFFYDIIKLLKRLSDNFKVKILNCVSNNLISEEDCDEEEVGISIIIFNGDRTIGGCAERLWRKAR